ncbi:MAG: hypothetical protein FJX64_10335 [Alphaproteobacteria bacterium]|nr:hypothetical protein [Alphaproteobacteria bacterium]
MAVDRRSERHLRWAPALWGVALLALAACAGTTGSNNPTVTFTHLQPLRFNATEVQFVDNYRPPLAPPNVEHQFQQTPAAAVRDWARSRIAAAGQAGTVRVTVVEASVVEVRLTTRKGIGGLFYNEQDTRYDGTVEVTIDFVPRAGVNMPTSQARARAVRTQTMPESSTVNQRSTVYVIVLRGLMEDIDAQLVAAMRQYMAAAIVP